MLMHPPLIICYTLPYQYVNDLLHNEIKYNWNKANYKQIVCNLGAVDRNIILNDNNDIDSTLSLFYFNVFLVINVFVLTFEIQNKSNFPKWFSHELKRVIIEKKMYHLSFKKSNNLSDYIKFSILKSKSKSLRERDYFNYIK